MTKNYKKMMDEIINKMDESTQMGFAVKFAAKKDGEIITTLIDKFKYPKLGPGMMWDSAEKKLREDGHKIVFNEQGMVEKYCDYFAFCSGTFRSLPLRGSFLDGFIRDPLIS